MSAIDILDTAQYVVDKDGRQTAVLLDLSSWQLLRQLLEELAEDEKLGELMTAVKDDEKLEGAAAHEAYQTYYKIRVGDYRMGVYLDADEELIEFQRVLHRREIYRKFP